MQMIKKVLVPVDFSDYSKSALSYAADFSKHFKAKVYLIYVVEPAIYPADFSLGQVAIPTPDLDITEKAEKELSQLAEEYLANVVESEVVIKTGKAFVEINEFARECDADLIIISTHGHTGVEHLLFGSTAEKVVRKAPCPVLSLREPIKGFKFTK